MLLELTNDTFEAEVLLYTKTAVLVDFWAPWCGPCKSLTPIIDELSKTFETTLKVCKLNIDEAQAIAAKFQITSIPCCLLFKDGQEVNRTIGFKSFNDFETLCKKYV